jgi:hypothetical protein
MELQIGETIVPVDTHVANLFSGVKTGSGPIVLEGISIDTLKLLLDFAETLVRMDEADRKLYATPEKWDDGSSPQRWYVATFTKLNIRVVFQLANVATQLGFGTLHNICCFHIAQQIKGKNTVEIRNLLGIENDFTPEEETKLSEELSWLNSDDII